MSNEFDSMNIKWQIVSFWFLCWQNFRVEICAKFSHENSVWSEYRPKVNLTPHIYPVRACDIGGGTARAEIIGGTSALKISRLSVVIHILFIFISHKCGNVQKIHKHKYTNAQKNINITKVMDFLTFFMPFMDFINPAPLQMQRSHSVFKKYLKNIIYVVSIRHSIVPVRYNTSCINVSKSLKCLLVFTSRCPIDQPIWPICVVRDTEFIFIICLQMPILCHFNRLFQFSVMEMFSNLYWIIRWC